MAQRRLRENTPLGRKQQELSRQADTLRKQMEDLQRMIAEVPQRAEELTRRQKEEILRRANEGRERLDVTMTLRDKRYGDDLWSQRRPRSLRRQRSEGRLLFIVLVLALSAAIIWIASHLHL